MLKVFSIDATEAWNFKFLGLAKQQFSCNKDIEIGVYSKTADVFHLFIIS